jgi:uncharacterized protein involved in response to NO
MLMLAGGIVRILFPLLTTQYYNAWILISQILWILAFMMFAAYYFPVLTKQSIDE